MILQNFQFKIGLGIEGQKVCNQFRGQGSMEAYKILKFYMYQMMKINSKAFAIPILTTLNKADLTAVRIGIANTLGFIFII